MASALAAEIRDRHADQRIDARRQIQREAAKKYREEAEQPSMIGEDAPDRGAGIIAAADTAALRRASRAYPLRRARRRARSRQRDCCTDRRRPQAFVVVAALEVDGNRERVARLRREVRSRLERHLKLDIAPEH